ncbi:MAG: DUF192 domain-containing protein [Victivallales bacterium]|nr:DUF192 domain-containing protein [Victivallales bacterium]
MIGRDFTEFDSMVFNRCNAVHTLFMGIPLDLVFLNTDNEICKIAQAVRPWRLMIKSNEAYSVIELPAGAVEKTGTALGDVLDLNATITREMENKLKSKDIINMETVITFKESER